MTYIFLIVAIIVLVICIVVQKTMVVIAKRQLYQFKRAIAKERQATTDILTLSRNVITKSTENEEFLNHFIEYALRTLQATGGVVFVKKGNNYQGCAVAGTFPPMKELPLKVANQLMAHSKKHTEFIKNYIPDFSDDDVNKMCSQEGFAFFDDDFPKWVHPKFKIDAPRLLLAPIKSKDVNLGIILITSKNDFDSHTINKADGQYLVRLNQIASLSLEVIKVFRERQEYEERVQTARKEGMIQVSTGIIHNIGNAVTVAKLAVLELQDKIGTSDEERPEDLILNEILPLLKKHVEDSTISDFLTKDQIGSQYLDILDELITHQGANMKQAIKQLDSLSIKLYHISEIIELQQRFVGELGTENLTQLSGVIDSTIKIFEETFNKRGLKIETDLQQGIPEVLIDPSMMTQVFMNIIKNAVEAMDTEDITQDHGIKIKLYDEYIKEKHYASIEIRDNGPGIPEDIQKKIFSFGFSTKSKPHTRGYGLHSCMDTIEKYGGKIDLESEVGVGTTFKISIPIGGRSMEKA